MMNRRDRLPTNRRGFAMMAALRLVVAIAAVTLHFAIDSRERRQLGIEAAERGRARGAALGALAMTQARLDYALQQVGGQNAQTANLRAADPWLGIDSLFGGPMYVDSVLVDVRFKDPTMLLNINAANEVALRSFFDFLLKDTQLAAALSQSIMDWRDPDSLPRVNGAERDDYIKKHMLALPTNTQFREVEELNLVMGVTPEIYAEIAPYLTTRGTGQVNVNSAPEAVLRTLPGITDDIVARILGMRSNGRRINSLNEVFAGQQQPGRGGGTPPQQQRMQGQTTLTTNLVEISMTAWAGRQALPSRLIAEVQRSGTRTSVTSRRW
jgi:general secretion pathway protein K